jgi:hypothetical protein
MPPFVLDYGLVRWYNETMNKMTNLQPSWWTDSTQVNNAQVTIELTLPKVFQKKVGPDVVLNGCRFVNGVHQHQGPRNKIVGLIRYFERSFECAVVDLSLPKPKPGKKASESAPVVEAPAASAQPTPKQQTIIAALETIPSEGWEGEPAHPTVAQVTEFTKDLTITLEEIVAVIDRYFTTTS